MTATGGEELTGARSDAVQAMADRWALAAFVAFLVLAFVHLIRLGGEEWFSYGDWALFSGPASRNVFQPVEQHWTTVPILLYRLLLAVFGLEFTPYLVVAVALHLAIAMLLWVLARRSGVRPWIAAASVAPMVLFSPGYLSILAPIQITQNLSIVCGIGQFLLADDDRQRVWRSLAGLGLGAVGLMSSGLMPAVVVGVGFGLVVRRGWRVAAVQTVPLAVMFTFWYLRRGPDSSGPFASYQTPTYDVGGHVRYVVGGLIDGWAALGSYPVVSLALALVVVSGLAIRLAERPVVEQVRAIAPAIALAVGAVVYLTSVGFQRSGLPPSYRSSSHHLYNVVVMCLPLLAVGIGAWVSRVRLVAPVMAALLLVVVVANGRFDQSDRPAFQRGEVYLTSRPSIAAEAADPDLDARARAAPNASAFPDKRLTGLSALTLEWLVAVRDAGKVPDASP